MFLRLITGLNEVYQGGLSSYSLINMIIAHLQCEGFDASNVIEWINRRTPVPTGRGRHKRGAERKRAAGGIEPEEGPGPLQFASVSTPEAAEGATGFDGVEPSEPASSHSDDLFGYLRAVADVSHHEYDLGMLLTSFLQRYEVCSCTGMMYMYFCPGMIGPIELNLLRHIACSACSALQFNIVLFLIISARRFSHFF